MKFLLDTDHISILQRRSGLEFSVLSVRIGRHSPMDLAFSVVSFHEQVFGCNNYISRARDSGGVIRGYEAFVEVLHTFKTALVLPFDAAAASVFSNLLAQRIRVATMDLRIASIALSRGLILLTRNVSDFARVPGLVTEDWTA